MENAVILIDGGYFNRILKNNFGDLNLDYLKFCELICEMLKVKRLRTYYYNCLPFVRVGNELDKKRLSNVQKFLGNLKRLPRFEVKIGKLQFIGGKFRQKMVDVLMSLDIVKKSIGSSVGHIILIAGDADFVPAIKIAKDSNIIAHLFYHPSSVHNELLDEIDELHVLDKDLIDKCRI
ncbi:NYN domain-containing protein [Candidatus Pacearchaeota archaeon]|nr:NYN domain-containing protein [Candidatus Pacearchaeota archaeon]